MPVNGIYLGSDTQLILQDSVAGQITVNIIQSVQIQQLTKQLDVQPLTGAPLYADLPKGWKIMVDNFQADSKLMDFVMRNEDAFYAGKAIGKITATSLIVSLGARYRFTGGTMKLGDGGTFKGLEQIVQKAEITFSRGYKA